MTTLNVIGFALFMASLLGILLIMVFPRMSRRFAVVEAFAGFFLAGTRLIFMACLPLVDSRDKPCRIASSHQLLSLEDIMQATRGQVAEVARRFAEVLDLEFTDGAWLEGQATVVEGSHEGVDADWIISWEEGPFGWVDSAVLTAVVAEVFGGGWYAQPINHWCVAFYN